MHAGPRICCHAYKVGAIHRTVSLGVGDHQHLPILAEVPAATGQRNQSLANQQLLVRSVQPKTPRQGGGRNRRLEEGGSLGTDRHRRAAPRGGRKFPEGIHEHVAHLQTPRRTGLRRDHQPEFPSDIVAFGTHDKSIRACLIGAQRCALDCPFAEFELRLAARHVEGGAPRTDCRGADIESEPVLATGAAGIDVRKVTRRGGS